MLRYALLGLLAKKPLHGYNMKNKLEKALGGHWEINFGQIYNTLARLERDKCVKVTSKGGDSRGKKTYAITVMGRNELDQWLIEPVEKPRQLRDEFFIKLIVRKLAGMGNAIPMINRQRRAYLHQLRSLTALAEEADDPVVALLIEGAILHLQADLHWLSTCSDRMELTRRDEKKYEKK